MNFASAPETMTFDPAVMFTIELFGRTLEFTETITTTWAIMAVLLVFGYIAGRNFEKVPRGLQNFVEILIEGIRYLVESTMGKDKLGFLPYMGSLMLYLLVANLIGLIGIRPPTADLNTTLGLAVITFVMIHYNGMKRKGVGKYLKGFTEPMFFLLPLNIIGELATPFSMAFRLFGNILGGVIIMTLAYSVVPILLPIPLHGYFDVFAGVIQTFIFAMLTMTFVAMAMD